MVTVRRIMLRFGRSGVFTFGGAFLIIVFFLWKRLSRDDAMQQWNDILLKGGGKNTKLDADFKSKGLLINTTGCKLELVEAFDDRYPETTSWYKKELPFNCAVKLPPLTALQGGQLQFDSATRQQHYQSVTRCVYKAFFTDPDDKKNVLYGPETVLDLQSNTPIKDEFVMVYCYNAGNQLLYRNMHQQIIVKPQRNGQPFPTRNPEDLNVIGITFESISRLSFLRQCPEIHDYIVNHLGGIMLDGFNKVGDNTAPNLYPLIMGKHLFDDWKNLLLTPLDDMDWIFKEFEKNGYATLMHEEATGMDMPAWAKWFRKEPTIHAMRPVRIQWHLNKAVPEDQDFMCYGSAHKFNTTLNWITEFMQKYKEKKTMVIATLIKSIDTHDKVNALGRIKHFFFDFLKQLERDGALNNTVLFFASDHGIRSIDYIFTNAGAYEARLPFAYVIVPKWFQKKYPQVYKNMKLNGKNRVTSAFDGWKTLKAILGKDYTNPNPPMQVVDESHLGMSIFAPIPESRSCPQAGIAEHWCACGTYKKISNSDPRAVKAGEILIRSINGMLNESKCVLFKDFSVTDAKLMLPSNDIRLSIKTTPIKADFRSTIKLTNDKEVVVTNLERLDLYARFVKCLKEESHTSKFQILPLTCICKDSVGLA